MYYVNETDAQAASDDKGRELWIERKQHRCSLRLNLLEARELLWT